MPWHGLKPSSVYFTVFAYCILKLFEMAKQYSGYETIRKLHMKLEECIQMYTTMILMRTTFYKLNAQ